MAKKSKYTTASIPTGVMDDIDELIEELGHWPSRSAFVREAALTKIQEEKLRIRELKEEKKG